MNDNAKLWVEALESGKYKQSKGKLGSERNGYCCLGVACRVYEDTTGDTSLSDSLFKEYKNSCLSFEFTKVKEWLGLSTYSGNFYNEGDFTSLVDLNDLRDLTFEQIAEVIKSEPDGLFIKEG